MSVKTSKKITLSPKLPPETKYRSGFWNEEPEQAMEQPYTPPGRLLLATIDGKTVRVLGEGCYMTSVPNGD